MSVLEQLDLKNDIGQGGLTALALDPKRRNNSRMESSPVKDGTMYGTDTENGTKNAKVVLNFNSGKNDNKSAVNSSSKVSTVPRSVFNE